MLQLVEDRKIIFHGDRRPEKLNVHEKERELFDCLRLIIQNGYELREDDLLDIFKFIQIHELYHFDASE